MSRDTSQISDYLEDMSALKRRLAASRTVPEFTMQAVSKETGVPADTLRSWERRYGFPEPSRTDANYRLYSRQDIDAVAWLRDQTALGQSIREAINTFRNAMVDDPLETPPLTASPSLVPLHSLSDSLLAADLDAAQRTWDRLSIATSPDGLCSEVILPAHARIWQVEPRLDDASRLSANAFLLRKVTVLFDWSAPEAGSDDVVILTRGDSVSLVPACALATVLSRRGNRFLLPILDIDRTESILALESVPRAAQIVLVGPDDSNHAVPDVLRTLPDRDVRRWWYARREAQDNQWLPSPILSIADALSRSA
jgi:DNA-binding transcriptional MerR regulator